MRFPIFISRLAFGICSTMNPELTKRPGKLPRQPFIAVENTAAPWTLPAEINLNAEGVIHLSDQIIFFKSGFQIRICRLLIKRENPVIGSTFRENFGKSQAQLYFLCTMFMKSYHALSHCIAGSTEMGGNTLEGLSTFQLSAVRWHWHQRW